MSSFNKGAETQRSCGRQRLSGVAECSDVASKVYTDVFLPNQCSQQMNIGVALPKLKTSASIEIYVFGIAVA